MNEEITMIGICTGRKLQPTLNWETCPFHTRSILLSNLLFRLEFMLDVWQLTDSASDSEQKCHSSVKCQLQLRQTAEHEEKGHNSFEGKETEITDGNSWLKASRNTTNTTFDKDI
ncbi:hypothetical protein JTE90_006120 [Oedothorax gibbosus]|uniref:Uncharacterized protein n=1 Tax=Oedothorax gibbosus TaxID=931172 RepID=A0AAV6V500_9ARAC|nr:hypothetical protein JTE90_006120 [Oedothorax gibbosus]